jgi:predicted CXXCH cytochrome family protein
MKEFRRLSALLFLIVFFFLIPGRLNAYADEAGCLKCHGDLIRKKVVHPAVGMGCAVCHAALDTGTVPHKSTNRIRLGLFADTPDLCYSCHDKKKFEGKDVHPPAAQGMCTVCHNPHSADHAKLLTSSVPDLCYQCHDKKEFTKKYVHPPVAEGKCLACHRPHEADNNFLLPEAINKVCLGCHAEVPRSPHVTGGFGGTGHPVETKKAVVVGGKKMKLSCVSCHNPHSSAWVRLFQFQPPICEKCHNI